MGIEEHYNSILNTMPHLVLIVRPVTHPVTGKPDYLIEYVNQAWELISGSLASTVLGKFFSETVYNNTEIPWVHIVEYTVRNRKPQKHIHYSTLVNKWLDITVNVIDEHLLCIHVFDVTDIKEGETRLMEQNHRLSVLSTELASSKANLKKKLDKIELLNNRLEQIAYYDKLTGLPNRTRFSELIGIEFQNCRRSSTPFALAILDVDNLKVLNDTLGHEHGDDLLKQMSQRLCSFSGRSIQSSRFGGDEFLLLITGYDSTESLVQTVNEIRESLSEPYMILNAEIKSSVSIGVAMYPEDANTVADLLKNADIAMTDAKKSGKNSLALFHSLMQQTLVVRASLEQKMYIAVQEESFRLFYQPQFDVLTRKLRGFEALIRWFDTEHGYIKPDRFIPIAEENRLIIPLGDWILRKACTTLARWQRDFGFDGIISVNVSPVQLQSSGFINDLNMILAETGIEPQTLEIEITEGVLIHNFDESVSLLNEIKKIGVGISLDDFGTGYSSLSYLQYLPLSTLKIDKSFIANISQKTSIEYDITDAIVSLVTKQGIDTIAEGVETPEQYEIMKQMQCKTIQGYLTGKPMPEEDCDILISGGFYELD